MVGLHATQAILYISCVVFYYSPFIGTRLTPNLNNRKHQKDAETETAKRTAAEAFEQKIWYCYWEIGAKV